MTTSREDLESQALKAISACLYYDLADTVQEESDETLQAIISGKHTCEDCGE